MNRRDWNVAMVDELDGQLANSSELESLIRDVFPPVRHAFGYGSGVFVQQDDGEGGKMIDLLLVVDDANAFHTELLQRHSHHYSLPCRLGGPWFCAHVQNGFGAKLFFHAFVNIHGKLFKYGIIETSHILDDLTNWSYLYTAGRLHKPTLPLISDDQVIDAQLNRNLPYALATSLLLLDEIQATEPSNKTTATLSTVFQSIAQISYSGDPRMDVGGEDPNKVHKLVHGNEGQMERFRLLYQPILDDFSQRGLLSYHNYNTSDDTAIEWDASLLRQILPPRFATTTRLQPIISSIVRGAARTQSLKGILTAGVAKSAQYAMAKFSKGLLRQVPK
jgi:mitochondrial translocator assembly and maintenance protein 41